jgi:hypothetical protein
MVRSSQTLALAFCSIAMFFSFEIFALAQKEGK